jgi:hypothetical protein
MRIWRVFKVFYEIITDREIYFLLGLAIRDFFRKEKSDPKPDPLPVSFPAIVKERVKSMTAGR